MNVLEKMSKEIEQESKLPYEEKKKVSSAVIVSRDIDKKPYYEIKYKEINSCDYDIGYGSYDLSNVVKWLNEYFEFCNESKTCTNDILKQILEEIEHEAMTNEEIGRKQCEGMARAMNIIRSHMDKFLDDEKCFSDNHAFVVKNMTAEQFKELTKNQNSFKKAMERFNRNKGCMVYEVDSNAMEDAKPVSREFLEECSEVARKYKKNTENNKCSDCSRRKWYQIGYRDGKNEVENDGWIPVEERLPKEPEFMEDSYIVQQENVIDPFSAYWDGKEWTDVNDDKVEEVIAWQPLPEPYKPKKQD